MESRSDAPSPRWRCPAWLRLVAWMFFWLWTLAACLFVARWWLMKGAQARIQRLVQAAPSPGAIGSGGMEIAREADKLSEPQASRGIPLRELPLIGKSLEQGDDGGNQFERAREELAQFTKGLKESRHDGLLSFRELMRLWGVEGADGMTEEQAAAEFIRRASNVGELLEQWGQAVAMGPWDIDGNPRIWGNFSMTAQVLLGALVEAHWRFGDTATATELWDVMRHAAERSGDSPVLFDMLRQQMLHKHLYQTMRAGFALNAWSDTQLAGMSQSLAGERTLDSMRRAIAGEKAKVSTMLDRSREYPADFMQVNPSVAPILAALTTNQQLADNAAMLHSTMDRALDRFDPATGLMVPAVAGTAEPSSVGGSIASWFDRYYFMYSAPFEGAYRQLPAENVVRAQSENDQAQLAIALELHRRQSGQYPESLDAVSGRFPSGMPRDIATGETYGYRPLPEGGYQLWGSGFDQMNDGGTLGKDVVWTHELPPPK